MVSRGGLDERRWSERFPGLFRSRPFTWGDIADERLRIQFSLAVPPDELISNVKVIGRCGDGVVVFETTQGWRNLPGGTREPEESLAETAARETQEEVGGRIVGELTWLGAFRVDHSAAGRHRPHLPWPISYWAYVVADVELVGEPTNPPDGEVVTSVLILPGAQAIEWLSVFDDGPLLDVVRLADELGLLTVGVRLL
ncbi:NUDIX hydrolase [Pseudactinotalea sp.]|uniref:NUDIX hydrolase n=1 Tax=Pseudactinotalea sp. TaxID=1926260 RepID=UPI003B3B9DB9